jgi:DNA-binding winged helix-turn-helix (wHTH) protein
MTTRIVFDGWTLLPATGELTRDGSRRRLQAQSLQVLLFLLRRPGELVARDELVADLWPDVVVDHDAGLNAVIRKLRIALDDDAESPRYIETVPRRGYRYVGRPPAERGEEAHAVAVGLDMAITAGGLDPVAGPPNGSARSRPGVRRYAAIAALAVAVLTIVWSAWRATTRDGSVRSEMPRDITPRSSLSRGSATPIEPPTSDPAAYDAYLKARLAYRDGDWLGAVAQASAAIGRDAEFGPAYLTRAAAAGMAIVFNVDASEARLADMQRDLQQAARLMGARDPMFIGVDAMYASIGGRDHLRAMVRFDEAQAAGLSDPALLRTRAMQQVVVNRLEDAITAHRALAALDPDNFVLVNMTAVLLSFARRPDEALQIIRLVRERFPQQPLAELTHARLVFAYSGATSEWRQAFERAAVRLTPDQRLQESFDLLRYERRERELLDRLKGERRTVVSAGTFNSLPLCCVGTRPVAEYRGWAALLTGDKATAAQEGQQMLAFVAREQRTRWNDWYLKLLEAEGLLMTGRHEEATAAADQGLALIAPANNMVHWRYAAAIGARVFAWGNAKERAVDLLEALARARPGLRPAEITRDPIYRLPLDGHPGYMALCAALDRKMTSE